MFNSVTATNELMQGIEREKLSAASDCYALGDKIRLLKDIWDDGEDHHPPGYCARSGEIVIVRRIDGHGGVVAASHENRIDNAFLVYPGEYERA
jgi:hypothetical protein